MAQEFTRRAVLRLAGSLTAGAVAFSLGESAVGASEPGGATLRSSIATVVQGDSGQFDLRLQGSAGVVGVRSMYFPTGWHAQPGDEVVAKRDRASGKLLAFPLHATVVGRVESYEGSRGRLRIGAQDLVVQAGTVFPTSISPDETYIASFAPNGTQRQHSCYAVRPLDRAES